MIICWISAQSALNQNFWHTLLRGSMIKGGNMIILENSREFVQNNQRAHF